MTVADIVERLRDPLIAEGKAPWKLRLEAADEITRLREVLEQGLQNSLKMDAALIKLHKENKVLRATPEITDAREQVALIVLAFMNDESGNWPIDSLKAQLAAKSAEHSGDCTKQPWSCLRCIADQCYEQTDKILAALTAALSTREKEKSNA